MNITWIEIKIKIVGTGFNPLYAVQKYNKYLLCFYTAYLVSISIRFNIIPNIY